MAIFPNKKKHIEILFLSLLFTSCFGLILLNFRIFKYLFTLILFSFCLIKSKSIPCKKAILCYALSVGGSCVYSAVCNHQNFIKVIGNSYTYWSLLFVFITMSYKPTANQIEKVIKYLSITFCLCYLTQWAIYPTAIFTGGLDDLNISNDIFRMRMPGSICAYCLFFYGVNKYILHKRKSDLLYALLGFLPIIIMGFRSLVAATALFAMIMIPFVTKSITKTFVWLAVGGAVLIGVSQLNIVQTKLDEMMERQESGQTFNNEDYIRFLAYEYFDESIFIKPGERFFGGGVPVEGTSAYYRNMTDAVERLHFFWTDLGLIGLSYIIGIPAVLLLVGIVLYCIHQTKLEHMQYIRFTLLTVLLGSIMTSMELFRTGNILIISLYLCLIYTVSKESRLHCKNIVK